MRQSFRLRQELRQSIDDEIAGRTKIHQSNVARLKAAPALAPPPLVMLAHGDSWFDYPLTGNGLPFADTDIIAQLQTMGNPPPLIDNISHYGDASTDEMSRQQQQRMIQHLQDPANWTGAAKPDAILFSGGGNDIVGDRFCIFLDYVLPGATGLNRVRFDKALGMVEASYLDLFAFRNQFARDVPIFAHCYDFPIPNGAHPDCIGPWLKPSLDFCGWNLVEGTVIAHNALEEFKALLQRLAGDADNKFILVDTQDALADADWANELHPFPNGFQKFAARFVTALQARFPGRI
jgi:hypothetical protein